MYDDLLGPRKPKEKEEEDHHGIDEEKFNLRKKYKLDEPPDCDDSEPTDNLKQFKFNIKEDPWNGAGKDLSNEEEETELELDIEDYGDLDEEIEKALKAFGDDDEDENELPDFEDVCDGCSDDDCDDCTTDDDNDDEIS